MSSSFQIEYVDTFNETQVFSPMFNTEFLLANLALQQSIENITTKNGFKLTDVCNAPLSPQENSCNMQNIWY